MSLYPQAFNLYHNFYAQIQPYSMRICVLSVMAEIVTKVLHSDVDLDTAQEDEHSDEEPNESENRRKCRDSYLEHLLDHINDVHVYVRSKVRA